MQSPVEGLEQRILLFFVLQPQRAENKKRSAKIAHLETCDCAECDLQCDPFWFIFSSTVLGWRNSRFCDRLPNVPILTRKNCWSSTVRMLISELESWSLPSISWMCECSPPSLRYVSAVVGMLVLVVVAASIVWHGALEPGTERTQIWHSINVSLVGVG